MKKLIFLFATLSTTLLFSQKTTAEIEKNLYKLWNDKTANLIYAEDDTKQTPIDVKKSVIKFYTCMVKNYKINPKNYTEFMSDTEFKKEMKKQETEETAKHSFAERNSLQWNSYARWDYQYRIGNQKEFSKCIKKSDIDY